MIKITEEAANHIKKIMNDENLGDEYFLRCGIEGGGCSGLSYILGFDVNKTEIDIEDEQYGIKILVDNKSNLYINEAILGYTSDLLGGGLKFENPKAKNTCGCGKSFC